MDMALTWFIRIWLGIAVAVNVMAIIGFYISAETWWQGWQTVSEIYSPFNLINWVMEVVLISPAIGVYMWRERRRKKAAENAVSP